METTVLTNPLDQYCLEKLQKMLDLAMQTAEAASAESNHKVVLQAVREVTRIVTLITKLGNPRASKAAAAAKASTTLAGSVPDEDVAALADGLTQDVLKFFPGLTGESKTDKPNLATQNPLFWKQGKSGKSRSKKRR